MLDSSPENDREGPSSIKTPTPASDKFYSSSYPNHNGDNGVSGKDGARVNTPTKISNQNDLFIVIDLSFFLWYSQLQEELRREKERRKALEVEVRSYFLTF